MKRVLYVVLIALLGMVLTASAHAQTGQCMVDAVRQENLQGQSVTMVTFGGAALTGGEIAADDALAPTVEGITRGGINVRAGAGTDFAVLGGLDAGAVVTIIGRTTAGDWLQIAFGADGVAWVFAELIAVDGDLPENLPLVDSNEAAALNLPVRAFTLAGGDADADCAGGLLLQAPTDGGQVRLLINNVRILFEETILVRLNADGALTLYALTQPTFADLRENSTLTLAAGDALSLSDPTPYPYTYAEVSSLPLDELPERAQIAPPESVHLGISPDGDCTVIAADGTATGETILPAGTPIAISSAVRGNPDALALFARSAQRNLFLEGEPLPLWSIRGPFADAANAEREYVIWWWVLPELAAGSYTLTMETIGTGSNLDGEVICTVEVVA